MLIPGKVNESPSLHFQPIEGLRAEWVRPADNRPMRRFASRIHVVAAKGRSLNRFPDRRQ
ncbi:hypothetical protein MMAD_13520 [Mycolicibacterium madagascariense]|uniref:Uncharacterized protein n=1 Tax=Mycolicibacterium madagascariense TaxID=212765 RepID=A0A7I7XDM7_9MYCO|nr:hypothetical protein MMAD_13520 [Mycolicibacterium madagascariense]